MLAVTHSNRLEMLAERLAELMRDTAGSPLRPEVVVVQSAGMARWLSLQLARALGIAANVRFPLPASFLWETFRALVPGVPESSPLQPRVAVWHLLAILDMLEDAAAFGPLHAYLRAADERGRHELAAHIADLFDQYLVYRPQWIARWEAGEEGGWQAELWRRLVARTTEPHRARVQDAALRALAARPPQRLPPRVAVFGIPTLPPAYLHAFRSLADHADVHLFLLEPCREYWGDLVAERDLPRRARGRAGGAPLREPGAPLLASLGKQGRDFLDLVVDCEAHREDAEFVEPGDDTLLHALQTDMLTLRARDGRVTFGRADRSLQVHVCHGPMREVEVLHDQLLRLFEHHPDLAPADVVVMTPDLEAYAPCVEAVFGGAPEDRRIPFTIADRSLRAESPVVEAFLGLLELPGSRFDASHLLGLLETPAVLRRFGLVPGDLDLVQRLVTESAVRWGVDAAGRARLGLPAVAEHTWRFGLDRLLLGFALPGGESRIVEGVLPCDVVEGSDAQVLGRLAAFVEAAAALEDGLAAPRPLAVWAATLTDVLERFVEPDDEEAEAVQAIRTALQSLADDARRAGDDAPRSLELVRAVVRGELEYPVAPGRFLAGGVTVCAMVPMRSIPFEVVCLVGMNDGSFPRTRRPPSFDLMAHPEPGDRSRRDDDRYLFLETVLSARRCLHLSYVGRGIRDNAEIPPSIVVSELLESVQRGFDAPQVVTVHPLQAFSRRYFASPPAPDAALVSYSAELCEASKVRLRQPVQTRRLLEGRLPDLGPGPLRVDAGRFLECFANPTAYLLRHRLGVRLEEASLPVEDREPFVLDALAAYTVRTDLLALCRDKRDLRDVAALLRARGLLPHGRVGEVELVRQRAVVEEFAERLDVFTTGASLEPIPIDLVLGAVHLEGMLDGVAQHGLVDYRLAKPKARDQLRLWIRHLLLHLVAPPEVARRSVWLGSDKALVFGPVADPRRELEALTALYHEGLHRLLPLFPRTSLAYQDTGGSLDAARDEWEGSDFVGGERDDPYLAFAWRDVDPLDRDFERLAGQVMGPLLEHCREEGA